MGKGVVLRMKTKGHVTGDATISNVILSDVKSKRHEAASTQTNLGDATGIMSMSPTNTEIENIYDLQGRRTTKHKKGIYIVNGKKFVIK